MYLVIEAEKPSIPQLRAKMVKVFRRLCQIDSSPWRSSHVQPVTQSADHELLSLVLTFRSRLPENTSLT